MQEVNVRVTMKPRYSKPRRYRDFSRNGNLKCLKMLAMVIKDHEGVGKHDLWNRVTQLYPRVMELVFEEPPPTLQEVIDHTLAEQGLLITPDILYQRADKARRYEEFNPFLERVSSAYETLMNVMPEGQRDPRRHFTDEEVLEAMRRQQNQCFVCFAPFTRINKPQGDHITAHCYGGRTIAANCAALCSSCNSRKGSMTLAAYQKKFFMDGQRGRDLL